VSLHLLTCSPSVSPSRLLYRRGRKSGREIWITLYNNCLIGTDILILQCFYHVVLQVRGVLEPRKPKKYVMNLPLYPVELMSILLCNCTFYLNHVCNKTC
jgi:hypothetical protein